MDYVSDPGNWLVVFTAIVVVTVCVVLHYEVLNACHRYLPKISHRRRRRVLILIFVVLLTHVAEIWVFGVGYYVLVHGYSLGTLTGLPTTELPDLPIGAIRFLAGMEGLTGFVMITWSASYTFLEMQRDWKPE